MKTQFVSWDNWIQLSTYRQYEIQLELAERCRELEDIIDEGKDSFTKCQEKADANSEL